MVGWRGVGGGAGAEIGSCGGGVGARCTGGQSACRRGRWVVGIAGVVEGLVGRRPCEEEPVHDCVSGTRSKVSATSPMICGVLED